MIGELLGGIADEFTDAASYISERQRNKQILKGAYNMASTGATMQGWEAMLLTMAAPAPM